MRSGKGRPIGRMAEPGEIADVIVVPLLAARLVRHGRGLGRGRRHRPRHHLAGADRRRRACALRHDPRVRRPRDRRGDAGRGGRPLAAEHRAAVRGRRRARALRRGRLELAARRARGVVRDRRRARPAARGRRACGRRRTRRRSATGSRAEARGRGLATAATSALSPWAFRTFACERHRAARRAGQRRVEARRREVRVHAGRGRDHHRRRTAASSGCSSCAGPISRIPCDVRRPHLRHDAARRRAARGDLAVRRRAGPPRPPDRPARLRLHRGRASRSRTRRTPSSSARSRPIRRRAR